MEVRTAIFVDERELQAIISSYFAQRYEVISVDFELEHHNGNYSIGGARVMATPKTENAQ